MSAWNACISLMDETNPAQTTTPTQACGKSTRVWPIPETKIFNLEDGCVRIEIGSFWKVVSSHHLIDPAEQQLLNAYRDHHTH
jgi:hypothetical protein